MKALVAGWFSFEGMGASAGDLMARDVVCDWLGRLHVEFDVALARPFEGGVSWETVDPEGYTHFVFVCGPIGNGPPVDAMLARFTGRHMVGVNLTMLHDLDEWNPFETLIERDSSRISNPDLAFASHRPLVPVVALTLIDTQPEYGSRNRMEDAHRMIGAVLNDQGAAVIEVDTRLDIRGSRRRTAAEVESIVAKADIVVTTRLHGMVLGLKNAVPVLAIDSVSGGAKLSEQASVLGWPVCLAIDDIDVADVARAYERCLTPNLRELAAEIAKNAATRASELDAHFARAFRGR